MRRLIGAPITIVGGALIGLSVGVGGDSGAIIFFLGCMVGSAGMLLSAGEEIA